MTELTQKYTIIQLLEPLEESAEWAIPDWPLHVTIADVFSVDCRSEDLVRMLSGVFSEHRSFTAVAGHDEYFGENQATQVTLLDMNEELVALHRDVVALLKGEGAVFNTPQYIEEGFRAHATVRPHNRLQKGDRVTFDALTLVDMFPSENPHRRKILKTIKLG